MIRLLLLFLLALPIVADDTIPKSAIHISDDHDIDPRSLKVGQSACVFPDYLTKERHIWVNPKNFYSSSLCIATVTKLANGWRINLQHIPEVVSYEHATDSEVASLGWIRMTEIVP
jgi:hypothetical protein